MGQKVHPFGFRLGITKDWRSRWYAEGPKFAKYLDQDIRIRKYLDDRLARAGIARVEIERADKSLNIFVFTARPGIVIGKGGMEVDQVRKDIEKIADTNDVQISVLEVRFPEQDAKLLAQNVAEQLVARVPFRRAMRRALTAAMKTGAKGVKVMIAGRLGGREMARTEWSREGQVPLHTLRADIDYGFFRAATTFGSIGVKVWLYKGEKTGKREVLEEEPLGLAKPKKPAEEPLGLVQPRKPAKKKVEAEKADAKKEEKPSKTEIKVEEKPAEEKAEKKAKAKETKKETEKKEVKPKKKTATKKAKAEEKETKSKKETKVETKSDESKEKMESKEDKS